MDVPMTRPRVFTRTPLTALAKLTIGGLIGLALAFVYLQAAMIGMLIPPLTVFVVVSLVIAGMVATGWRWAPALGAVWSALIVAGDGSKMVYSLSHPAEFGGFVFTILLVAMMVLCIGAGIGAVVQNYRSAERATPRTLPATLAAFGGICLGAILVAAVAAQGVGAGISPQTLASLPALTTTNFAFSQPELRVKSGEMVTLRLENTDNEAHSLDIDELGVHALIPVGQPGVALFTPSTPGTYTFYCAPHYDKTTGVGMKGTLIVE